MVIKSCGYLDSLPGFKHWLINKIRSSRNFMATKSQEPWHLKSARKLGPVLERGDNYTIARSNIRPNITVMFIGGKLGNMARILDNHATFEHHDYAQIVSVAKDGRLFHSFERKLLYVQHVDRVRDALKVAQAVHKLLVRYAPK